MLLQICNYLQRQGLANAKQISQNLQIEISALQPMLNMLLAKGLIKHRQQEVSCHKTCLKCDPQKLYYQLGP